MYVPGSLNKWDVKLTLVVESKVANAFNEFPIAAQPVAPESNVNAGLARLPPETHFKPIASKLPTPLSFHCWLDWALAENDIPILAANTSHNNNCRTFFMGAPLIKVDEV